MNIKQHNYNSIITVYIYKSEINLDGNWELFNLGGSFIGKNILKNILKKFNSYKEYNENEFQKINDYIKNGKLNNENDSNFNDIYSQFVFRFKTNEEYQENLSRLNKLVKKLNLLK